MAASTIRITVKIVGGRSCDIDVKKNMNIADLKKSLSIILNIPIQHQKLLYKGKPLVDEKDLSQYKVGGGAKIYLMKSKECCIASGSADTNILQIEMKGFLIRFFSEVEAEKITQEYMKGFHKSLNQYSLDDWQRVATKHLKAIGECVE